MREQKDTQSIVDKVFSAEENSAVLIEKEKLGKYNRLASKMLSHK